MVRLTATPEFAQDSRLIAEAYEIAVDAHHGSRRRNDTNIDHPAAVGELLSREGFDDEVVAAGVLHDVVEDTDTEMAEIAQRFGPGVGELVEVMTEDASIEPYEARKAEHRARVARHSLAGGGDLRGRQARQDEGAPARRWPGLGRRSSTTTGSR